MTSLKLTPSVAALASRHKASRVVWCSWGWRQNGLPSRCFAGLGCTHQVAGWQGRRLSLQVLVGTSAGALNATYLASRAIDGLAALSGLGAFWHGLHSHLVYHLPDTPMAQFSRWATALGVTLSARKQGAALDSMPLVDTLHRRISLDNIDLALTRGDLKALAVTASSYTTGVHWTFAKLTNCKAPRHGTGPGAAPNCKTSP